MKFRIYRNFPLPFRRGRTRLVSLGLGVSAVIVVLSVCADAISSEKDVKSVLVPPRSSKHFPPSAAFISTNFAALKNSTFRTASGKKFGKYFLSKKLTGTSLFPNVVNATESTLSFSTTTSASTTTEPPREFSSVSSVTQSSTTRKPTTSRPTTSRQMTTTTESSSVYTTTPEYEFITPGLPDPVADLTGNGDILKLKPKPVNGNTSVDQTALFDNFYEVLPVPSGFAEAGNGQLRPRFTSNDNLQQDQQPSQSQQSEIALLSMHPDPDNLAYAHPEVDNNLDAPDQIAMGSDFGTNVAVVAPPAGKRMDSRRFQSIVGSNFPKTFQKFGVQDSLYNRPGPVNHGHAPTIAGKNHNNGYRNGRFHPSSYPGTKPPQSQYTQASNVATSFQNLGGFNSKVTVRPTNAPGFQFPKGGLHEINPYTGTATPPRHVASPSSHNVRLNPHPNVQSFSPYSPTGRNQQTTGGPHHIHSVSSVRSQGAKTYKTHYQGHQTSYSQSTPTTFRPFVHSTSLPVNHPNSWQPSPPLYSLQNNNNNNGRPNINDNTRMLPSQSQLEEVHTVVHPGTDNFGPHPTTPPPASHMNMNMETSGSILSSFLGSFETLGLPKLRFNRPQQQQQHHPHQQQHNPQQHPHHQQQQHAHPQQQQHPHPEQQQHPHPQQQQHPHPQQQQRPHHPPSSGFRQMGPPQNLPIRMGGKFNPFGSGSAGLSGPDGGQSHAPARQPHNHNRFPGHPQQRPPNQFQGAPQNQQKLVGPIILPQDQFQGTPPKELKLGPPPFNEFNIKAIPQNQPVYPHQNQDQQANSPPSPPPHMHHHPHHAPNNQASQKPLFSMNQFSSSPPAGADHAPGAHGFGDFKGFHGSTIPHPESFNTDHGQQDSGHGGPFDNFPSQNPPQQSGSLGSFDHFPSPNPPQHSGSPGSFDHFPSPNPPQHSGSLGSFDHFPSPHPPQQSDSPDFPPFIRQEHQNQPYNVGTPESPWVPKKPKGRFHPHRHHHHSSPNYDLDGASPLVVRPGLAGLNEDNTPALLGPTQIQELDDFTGEIDNKQDYEHSPPQSHLNMEHGAPPAGFYELPSPPNLHLSPPSPNSGSREEHGAEAELPNLSNQLITEEDPAQNSGTTSSAESDNDNGLPPQQDNGNDLNHISGEPATADLENLLKMSGENAGQSHSFQSHGGQPGFIPGHREHRHKRPRQHKHHHNDHHNHHPQTTQRPQEQGFKDFGGFSVDPSQAHTPHPQPESLPTPPPQEEDDGSYKGYGAYSNEQRQRQKQKHRRRPQNQQHKFNPNGFQDFGNFPGQNANPNMNQNAPVDEQGSNELGIGDLPPGLNYPETNQQYTPPPHFENGPTNDQQYTNQPPNFESGPNNNQQHTDRPPHFENGPNNQHHQQQQYNPGQPFENGPSSLINGNFQADGSASNEGPSSVEHQVPQVGSPVYRGQGFNEFRQDPYPAREHQPPHHQQQHHQQAHHETNSGPQVPGPEFNSGLDGFNIGPNTRPFQGLPLGGGNRQSSPVASPGPVTGHLLLGVPHTSSAPAPAGSGLVGGNIGPSGKGQGHGHGHKEQSPLDHHHKEPQHHGLHSTGLFGGLGGILGPLKGLGLVKGLLDNHYPIKGLLDNHHPVKDDFKFHFPGKHEFNFGKTPDAFNFEKDKLKIIKNQFNFGNEGFSFGKNNFHFPKEAHKFGKDPFGKNSFANEHHLLGGIGNVGNVIKDIHPVALKHKVKLPVGKVLGAVIAIGHKILDFYAKWAIPKDHYVRVISFAGIYLLFAWLLKDNEHLLYPKCENWGWNGPEHKHLYHAPAYYVPAIPVDQHLQQEFLDLFRGVENCLDHKIKKDKKKKKKKKDDKKKHNDKKDGSKKGGKDKKKDGDGGDSSEEDDEYNDSIEQDYNDELSFINEMCPRDRFFFSMSPYHIEAWAALARIFTEQKTPQDVLHVARSILHSQKINPRVWYYGLSAAAGRRPDMLGLALASPIDAIPDNFIPGHLIETDFMRYRGLHVLPRTKRSASAFLASLKKSLNGTIFRGSVRDRYQRFIASLNASAITTTRVPRTTTTTRMTTTSLPTVPLTTATAIILDRIDTNVSTNDTNDPLRALLLTKRGGDTDEENSDEDNDNDDGRKKLNVKKHPLGHGFGFIGDGFGKYKSKHPSGGGFGGNGYGDGYAVSGQGQGASFGFDGFRLGGQTGGSNIGTSINGFGSEGPSGYSADYSEGDAGSAVGFPTGDGNNVNPENRERQGIGNRNSQNRLKNKHHKKGKGKGKGKKKDKKKKKKCIIVDGSVGLDNGIENKLWYFREDMMMNQHHWYWHSAYPANASMGPNTDRRSELFFFMHRSMIARYNAERLSNGFHRTQEVDIRPGSPIEEGYDAHLKDFNSGKWWTPRKPNTPLLDILHMHDPDHVRDIIIGDVMDLYNKFVRSINLGKLIGANGQLVPIRFGTGFEALTATVEASNLSVNPFLYDQNGFHNAGHMMIGLSTDPDFKQGLPGGVMTDAGVSMRDPTFYTLHTLLDNLFDKYKKTLPPYRQYGGNFPLQWHGVDILDVKVQMQGLGEPNQLATFFIKHKFQLEPGVDRSIAKGIEKADICAVHLDHAPFQYQITIDRKKCAKSKSGLGTVRIFMAPRFNEHGDRLPLLEQRRLMFELDVFQAELKVGRNIITRDSRASALTRPWTRSLKDRQKHPDQSGAADYCGCGWPHHLLLPKGNTKGMAFDLFVMVTNFDEDFVPNNPADLEFPEPCTSAYIFCGRPRRRYPDARPMGYPFDRLPYHVPAKACFGYGHSVKDLLCKIAGKLFTRPAATLEEYVSGVTNMAMTIFEIKHIPKVIGKHNG